jgi:hypothetical protein
MRNNNKTLTVKNRELTEELIRKCGQEVPHTVTICDGCPVFYCLPRRKATIDVREITKTIGK